MGRVEEHFSILDRPRGAYLPRGQSAYEAFFVLGMGDRQNQREVSRGSIPLGGIYKASGDVPACESRLFSILYVFYVAKCETRDHRLFHGTYPNRSPRVLEAEPLAEYAGHSSRIPSSRRKGRVHGSAHSSGDSRSQLRN